MQLTYPCLAQTDENGIIQSFWFPDLKASHVFAPKATDRPKYIKQFLTDHLKSRLTKNKKIPRPNELSFFENDSLLQTSDNNIWLMITANVRVNKMLFEHILPFIGVAAMLVSAFCGSASAFMSILITAGKKNEETGKELGAIGAFINFIMIFTIFLFSGASSGLASMGRVFDDYLFCKSDYDQDNPHILVANEYYANKKNQSSTCRLLLKFCYFGLAVTDSVTAAITAFQQTDSLAKRTDADQPIDPEFIKFLAWSFAITTGISMLSFEETFANKAANAMLNCCSRGKNTEDEAEYEANEQNDEEQQILSSTEVSSIQMSNS